MNPDPHADTASVFQAATVFQADTADLRRHAADVEATARRLDGAGAAAPHTETTPRWATATAADLAAGAARRSLALIGNDTAETAQRITAAARAYEEADARAATRLRLTR
ncbi:hypothetical protein [Actinoplanes sp. NBRC 101535]|uniref:hypothetical protein n=1 Tax=Actinoplanes sp. NBRC 101535 TaxID=3032196 RepID=UPI0024A2CF7B|nr:hypothetical protein [Actinoplanes sp. NBRC 101535]GLY00878.1 hypothetical protein Acsp01_12570 [Actinoplanes sp. NBRC 101535]